MQPISKSLQWKWYSYCRFTFHRVNFQQLAYLSLPFSTDEVRNEKKCRGKLVRGLAILSLWKQNEGVQQHTNTLPCHKGLKKVTEILFLESLTFDLSNSCNLSSLQMCLWVSTATLKLTQVLYNFPIFPAPSVLNCIGRWIFGIWGCQVSAMEDFMH